MTFVLSTEEYEFWCVLYLLSLISIFMVLSNFEEIYIMINESLISLITINRLVAILGSAIFFIQHYD
jgi:hypothetical protein